MILNRSGEYLVGLVRELCELASESGWVEIKVNSHQSQDIGVYVSAPMNSVLLVGKPFDCIICGISNQDHRVGGTNFKPRITKVRHEELEN